MQAHPDSPRSRCSRVGQFNTCNPVQAAWCSQSDGFQLGLQFKQDIAAVCAIQPPRVGYNLSRQDVLLAIKGRGQRFPGKSTVAYHTGEGTSQDAIRAARPKVQKK